ncbi:GH32 C-terminal domain-containing protein [Varibaculum vaginae]|uniref:GH32 C-terminal domain-containing protein n=1 Tax=Varibaculum vaginae TaxID=2364797 RepID=UPI0011C3B685|nr:GH32 C-terminal domain-containing protein [Varibaculum vaginae]
MSVRAPQSMLSPDNRRLMFGWMGGFTLPLASQAEDGWSGQLATPREVSLSKDLEIIATPIPEFDELRENTVDKGGFTVETDNTVELASDLPVGEIELTVDLDKTSSEQVSLLVQQTSKNRYTEVAYDSLSNRVFLDRGKSGSSDRGYRSAPYVGGSQLKLRVIIDRGSIEVFINDGRYGLSSLAFPAEGRRAVSIASVGGVIAVSNLKIHSLKSIWGN